LAGTIGKREPVPDRRLLPWRQVHPSPGLPRRRGVPARATFHRDGYRGRLV